MELLRKPNRYNICIDIKDHYKNIVNRINTIISWEHNVYLSRFNIHRHLKSSKASKEDIKIALRCLIVFLRNNK